MIYVNERIQFKCITTFGSKFKNLLKKKNKICIYNKTSY